MGDEQAFGTGATHCDRGLAAGVQDERVVTLEQGFSSAATAVSAPTVILLPATAIALAVIAFRRRQATT